ncbi:hypothetical protein IG631_03381 [Alternaria alternata]|nr:hypothetical protein IG631_03381 [Alternaria alternata]
MIYTRPSGYAGREDVQGRWIRSATDVTWFDPQVSLLPPDVRVCCGRVAVGGGRNAKRATCCRIQRESTRRDKTGGHAIMDQYSQRIK